MVFDVWIIYEFKTMNNWSIHISYVLGFIIFHLGRKIGKYYFIFIQTNIAKHKFLFFVQCNFSIYFSDIQIFYWCSSSLPCDTNMDELALSESKHTSHPFSDEDVNDVHTRYLAFYSLLKIPILYFFLRVIFIQKQLKYLDIDLSTGLTDQSDLRWLSSDWRLIS